VGKAAGREKSLMSPTVPGKGVGGDPNRHVPGAAEGAGDPQVRPDAGEAARWEEI